MNDTTLITCVIPTYRRPRMVARAIRSVLNQTFSRLRVFVTDNASGDETGDVIRCIAERDPRVIYRCQSENIGMPGNFAYGMANIETPFFSLLSDDDVLLPEFYEIAYSQFQKYPQAIFVATQVFEVRAAGRLAAEPLSRWDRSGLFDPPSGAHRVAAIGHPTITGILWRREFLQTRYSKFNLNIHAGDYEMIFNAATVYPIVTVDRPGALFVSHRLQREKSSDPFSVINHFLDLINRVDEDERFPSEIKDANRKKFETKLSVYLRNLSIRLVLHGDHVSAEKALAIRSEKIGCRDYWNNLIRVVNHICQVMPPLRYFLRGMYAPVTRIRDRWQVSRLPFIESCYRELMKLE